MNLEKSNSVDQKRVDQKLARVKELLAAQPVLFRRQGGVVGTWRVVGDRQLGPYYALRYRVAGRQRSVYLGKSEQLAEQVQQLLTQWQLPARRQLEIRRFRHAAKASLRHHKVEWGKQLAQELGLSLKGFETRGTGLSIIKVK